MIGPYQKVGGRLRSRIGTVGGQGSLFGKGPRVAQTAVHFVGGNLHVSGNFCTAAGIEQDLRPDDIRPDEGPRVEQAAIDVTFGSEVHDRFERAFRDQRLDEITISDIAVPELVPRTIPDRGKVLEISGVGQPVEIDDRQVVVARQLLANELGPDESAATGDEQASHGSSHPGSLMPARPATAGIPRKRSSAGRPARRARLPKYTPFARRPLRCNRSSFPD